MIAPSTSIGTDCSCASSPYKIPSSLSLSLSYSVGVDETINSIAQTPQNTPTPTTTPPPPTMSPLAESKIYTHLDDDDQRNVPQSEIDELAKRSGKNIRGYMPSVSFSSHDPSPT